VSARASLVDRQPRQSLLQRLHSVVGDLSAADVEYRELTQSLQMHQAGVGDLGALEEKQGEVGSVPGLRSYQEPARLDGSSKRIEKPIVFHLGLDALRRRRADRFDLQGVGRLENRQRGPVPDVWRNVRTGDQLSERRHRVGGQRPNDGPEPFRPIYYSGSAGTHI
jgi:hypothetical protein